MLKAIVHFFLRPFYHKLVFHMESGHSIKLFCKKYTLTKGGNQLTEYEADGVLIPRPYYIDVEKVVGVIVVR